MSLAQQQQTTLESSSSLAFDQVATVWLLSELTASEALEFRLQRKIQIASWMIKVPSVAAKQHLSTSRWFLRKQLAG